MWPPYSAPCANCTLWATVEGPQATLENAFQGFAWKGFLEPREEAAPHAQTAVPQRAVPVPAPGAAPAEAEPAPAKVPERAAVVREKAELPSVPSKFSAEVRAEDPAQLAQIPLRALEEPTLARVLSDMASLVATLEARHRVDWAPSCAPKPPKPMAAQPIEPIDPIEPIKLELDRLNRIQISVVHAIGHTAQARLLRTVGLQNCTNVRCSDCEVVQLRLSSAVRRGNARSSPHLSLLLRRSLPPPPPSP